MFGRAFTLAFCLLAVSATSALAQGVVDVEAQPAETRQRMTSSMRGLDHPLRAYQRGIDALFHHDYQAAVDALRVYVAAYPDDPGGNLALGVAFVGNGENRAAIAPLERVLRAGDAPISAHAHLGLAHARLGNAAEARAHRNVLARRLRQCRSTCDQTDRDRISRAIDAVDQAIANPRAAAPVVRI